MSLMNFFRKPGVKLLLGALGLVGTNVLTARATIKFIKERESLGRETTLKEDIQIGMKCYGGAIAAGAASAAFLFAGNKGYLDNQDSLISSYNMLSNKYNNYKNAAMRTLGNAKVKEIEEKATKMLEKPKNISLTPKSEGSVILMDPFSDPKNPVFVETSMEQIIDSNHAFMRRIVMNPEYEKIVTVNEWRELQSFNDLDMKGEEFGYSQEYLENLNGCVWLDIDLEIRFDNGGTMYYYPVFRFEPIAGNSHQKHFL